MKFEIDDSCTPDKKTCGFSLGKKFCFYPGILTQVNYISTLKFNSTSGTNLNRVKGNFSVVLCKKKNPIWGVDGCSSGLLSAFLSYVIKIHIL